MCHPCLSDGLVYQVLGLELKKHAALVLEQKKKLLCSNWHSAMMRGHIYVPLVWVSCPCSKTPLLLGQKGHVEVRFGLHFPLDLPSRLLPLFLWELFAELFGNFNSSGIPLWITPVESEKHFAGTILWDQVRTTTKCNFDQKTTTKWRWITTTINLSRHINHNEIHHLTSTISPWKGPNITTKWTVQ